MVEKGTQNEDINLEAATSALCAVSNSSLVIIYFLLFFYKFWWEG